MTKGRMIDAAKLLRWYGMFWVVLGAVGAAFTHHPFFVGTLVAGAALYGISFLGHEG